MRNNQTITILIFAVISSGWRFFLCAVYAQKTTGLSCSPTVDFEGWNINKQDFTCYRCLFCSCSTVACSQGTQQGLFANFQHASSKHAAFESVQSNAWYPHQQASIIDNVRASHHVGRNNDDTQPMVSSGLGCLKPTFWKLVPQQEAERCTLANHSDDETPLLGHYLRDQCMEQLCQNSHHPVSMVSFCFGFVWCHCSTEFGENELHSLTVWAFQGCR